MLRRIAGFLQEKRPKIHQVLPFIPSNVVLIEIENLIQFLFEAHKCIIFLMPGCCLPKVIFGIPKDCAVGMRVFQSFEIGALLLKSWLDSNRFIFIGKKR